MQSSRLHVCLLLVAFLLASPLSFAQTIRYVTTTGTNSNPANATSWATSTNDLQGAINAVEAAGGGEVWVAAGVYKPGGNANVDRTISFSMKNGVAIYGGFAGNETNLAQRPAINPVSGQPSSSTLSGNIGNPGDNSDNSYHVISNFEGLTITAVLDGFIITGGNATAIGHVTGGGMLNPVFCSPWIRNCSFTGNSSIYGGALYNLDVSSPLLTNCSFIGNSAAIGGAIYNRSSPQLTNCSFRSNSATLGGAMYNNGSLASGKSNPTLNNCSFQDNFASQGGVMYNNGSVAGDSSPQMTNCSFKNNSASERGGVIFNDGTYGTVNPVYINCLFQDNSSSQEGGAIYTNGWSSVPSSNLLLLNCSFQGNKASQNGGALVNNSRGGRSNFLSINCSFQDNQAPLGGAIYYDNYTSSGSFQLKNCIVFNNGGNQTIYYNNTFVSATYSLFDQSVIGYNTTEPTNLTTLTSPFASSTSTELAPNSPAINAGSNQEYLNAGGSLTDLAGKPRISDNTIDMGAYEFQIITSLQVQAPQYNCSTGEFKFQSAGGNGSEISYMAIGITGWTTSAGPFTVKPYCDVQPFTLMARQASDPNTVVSYTWNYTATCPNACTTTIPPSTTGLSLLAPSYNCSTGAFSFQSTGGDGSPVSYRAIGITDWTTSPGPFTVKPFCDVQPFMLEARQASQPNLITTYQWNYVLQCPANCPQVSDRQASAEKDILSVSVLGNPTLDETVTLELQTPTLSPLQIRVTNSQGQTVSSQTVETSGGSQLLQVPLGKSSGMYLLQVSTSTQLKVVKVVRQ